MLNLMPFLRQMLRRPALRRERGEECQGEAWDYDPLSHPALQRMSLEELADLPFERGPCPSPPPASAGEAARPCR